MTEDDLKITIIYDNTSLDINLIPDWGFSCLVEAYGKKILFDTGAKGEILLRNMKYLDIDPDTIDHIVISHYHWDHTGGLSAILQINPVKVYIPPSCPEPPGAKEVIKVKNKLEISENIFSTGELMGIEQSLMVKTGKGYVFIVGCSHPGVDIILSSVPEPSNIYGLIGGFHGFSEFEILAPLKLVCPTHCTVNIAMIKSLYPEKYVEGGAGQIIEI